MKKRLSISDIILFSISGIFDLFDEIKDPGGLIKSYYENFYGFVPQRFKKVYIYKALNRNYKNNRVKKNNKKLFLNDAGKDYLKTYFPRLFYKSSRWNGCLYFVIFDVSELKRNHRDQLRILLKKLGFAYLQKSVWLTFSPSYLKPIIEFKKKLYLKNDILILKAKFENMKKTSSLIQRFWSLKEINKNYKGIYLQYQKILSDYRNTKNLQKLINQYREISLSFYQICQKDPFLPPIFLPETWYFYNAKEIKKKIAKTIKKANNDLEKMSRF